MYLEDTPMDAPKVNPQIIKFLEEVMDIRKLIHDSKYTKDRLQGIQDVIDLLKNISEDFYKNVDNY